MGSNLEDSAVDSSKTDVVTEPKNGTGPTPATVAEQIRNSGPQPVQGAPAISGAEALLRAQKDFILRQQQYIHDQLLSRMIVAQKKYIEALISAIKYASPSDADGEIAGAQETYITALTLVLEHKGLL